MVESLMVESVGNVIKPDLLDTSEERQCRKSKPWHHCLKTKQKHTRLPSWNMQHTRSPPSLVVSVLVALLNVHIRRTIHKLCQVEHVLLGDVGQAQVSMLVDLALWSCL